MPAGNQSIEISPSPEGIFLAPPPEELAALEAELAVIEDVSEDVRLLTHKINNNPWVEGRDQSITALHSALQDLQQILLKSSGVVVLEVPSERFEYETGKVLRSEYGRTGSNELRIPRARITAIKTLPMATVLRTHLTVPTLNAAAFTPLSTGFSPVLDLRVDSDLLSPMIRNDYSEYTPTSRFKSFEEGGRDQIRLQPARWHRFWLATTRLNLSSET